MDSLHPHRATHEAGHELTEEQQYSQELHAWIEAHMVELEKLLENVWDLRVQADDDVVAARKALDKALAHERQLEHEAISSPSSSSVHTNLAAAKIQVDACRKAFKEAGDREDYAVNRPGDLVDEFLEKKKQVEARYKKQHKTSPALLAARRDFSAIEAAYNKAENLYEKHAQEAVSGSESDDERHEPAVHTPAAPTFAPVSPASRALTPRPRNPRPTVRKAPPPAARVLPHPGELHYSKKEHGRRRSRFDVSPSPEEGDDKRAKTENSLGLAHGPGSFRRNWRYFGVRYM